MFERSLEVDCEDMYWNDTEVFNQYSHSLRQILYSMPEEGVLYVSLAKVKHMDFLFAWDTIALIQCKNGIGPLKHKHLIFTEPTKDVRSTMLEAVDEAGEAFLELDNKNILRASGRTMSNNLLRALFLVLKASQNNEEVTASDLLRDLDIKSPQASSDLLRELYGWGFICRREEAAKGGKRGRPVYKYHAFWPPNNEISWQAYNPESGEFETFKHPALAEKKIA